MKYSSKSLKAEIDSSFAKTEKDYIADPLVYCRNKNKDKYR